MQVAPSNPVLQALSGAQETGAVRQQAASSKVDSARAVQAAAQSNPGNQTQFRQRREPEDDDNTRPKPRGSIVDITV